MPIEQIVIYDLKIPFRRAIRHGLCSRSETESVIIQVLDDQGHRGFGEGVPRSYVTGETLVESLDAAESVATAMLGSDFTSSDALIASLTELGRSSSTAACPAAVCAMELAVLDWWARRAAVPVWHLFREQVPVAALTYSVVIPHMECQTDLQAILTLIQKLDFDHIKAKVTEVASGIALLQTIRRQLGPDVDLRVDANGVFNDQEALEFISKAAPLNLSALEQPVAREDIDGLCTVTRNSPIPIIADESLFTRHGPQAVIENGWSHGVNLRLSSCGGLLRTMQLYQLASARKMVILQGAHVGETAILSLAGRHLAALCPEHHYLEGSASTWVIQEDLCHEDITPPAGGRVQTPGNAGLGAVFNASILEKWSRHQRTVT